MTRPICAHCGGSYGRRYTIDETVRWPDGEEMPPYRGNMRVISERYHGRGMSKQDGESVARLRTRGFEDIARVMTELPDKPIHTAFRTLWDGETWVGGYNPFCTLRCALAYARAAYARVNAQRRA